MDKKKRDKAKTHYLVHKKFSINANFKSDRKEISLEKHLK